ncbi:MAG TPA: hypothetical protein VND93_31255 [Myxococcales bacterium]|nr:hypothetical protein [Myxococcales bacterium]
MPGRSFLLAALAACVAAGCATTGSGRFPSPAALDALGPAPAPAQLTALDTAPVERWELSGPLPEGTSVGPAVYEGGGFGAELSAFAREKASFDASADMACIARENGRFLLSQGAPAPRDLQRYIIGRCGSTVVRHRSLTITGDVQDSVPESEVLAHWREDFRKMLADLPAGGHLAAGVWFGHSKGKVLVLLAFGDRAVRLDPIRSVPAADGTVTLRGEVLAPAIRVEALVNKGRFQFASCEPEPSVQLPRFAFRCAVNRADPSTWASLFVYPPGRLLGNPGVEVLVFPQGQALSTFSRPAVPASPGADGGDDSLRFAQLLNGLRAEAGLPALVLSEGESATARKVAPHYFAATLGLVPPTVADTVALGLMAGWNVEQLTRGGYFSADWVGSGDVAALLAEMLDQPGARRTLFDPGVRAIAFGSFRVPERHVLGGLVATYATFDDAPPASEAKKVVDALDRQRAARGVGPVELVALPPDAREEMDQALASSGSSKDALRAVMARALQLTGQSVQGIVVETGSLDALQFPDELLRRSPLVVFVSVTHYRPKGEPWGRYVVAVAYTAQVGQTASRETTPLPGG